MTSRREQQRRWSRGPFGRLWLGFAFASSGDGLAAGAVPLLAVLLDPRPFAVSLVVAADALPWLFLALPAGAVADRFNRGPVMGLMNALRAVVILVGAVLIVTGTMSLGLLVVVVLLNGSGRAIYYSSLQAVTPDLVELHQLEHANGLLSGTESALEHLAGPAVGSVLFAASPSIPFFSDSVALVASTVPFMRLRTKLNRHTATARGSVWEGARYIFSDHRLRVLTAMVGSLALLQGMESGVLVLLATEKWGIRTALYGLFLAVGAMGNLIGSVLSARIVSRFGSAPTLLGAALLSGLAYLIMAPAQSWLLGGFAYFVVGFAVAAGTVVSVSLRQRCTPTALMGRVGGASRGITWGVVPLGAVAAGGLAAIGGLRLPILLAGILQCAVALALARPLLQRFGSEPGTLTPTPETS